MQRRGAFLFCHLLYFMRNLQLKNTIYSKYSIKLNHNKPIQKTMKTAKNLGIWMDHSSAHVMEFKTDPIETRTIASKFTYEEKERSLRKSESQMHIKERHEQADYYKILGEIIKNYEEVILFGPTDAKVELFNILRADHLFTNIKIELQQADKMTENQQHAFVREHFSRH